MNFSRSLTAAAKTDVAIYRCCDRAKLFVALILTIIGLSMVTATEARGRQSGRTTDGSPLSEYDFVSERIVGTWSPAHGISRLNQTTSGLQIDISGPDPYLIGPPNDYPADQTLWLTLRVKSTAGGDAQIFYFVQTPSEAKSVHFDCRAGVWEDVRVPLPPMGAGYRFRFDPPGDTGTCLISRLAVYRRTQFTEPKWRGPEPPSPVNENLSIQSGDLKLVVATAQWNDFILKVDGHPMAIGHTRPIIGIVENGQPLWLDIGGEVRTGRSIPADGKIVSTVTLGEPTGANWQVRQTFAPAVIPGAIDIKTEVSVDRDRNILYLPILMLLPGSGSFGQAKDHALFAGLEYLDENELSSSEADIVGPGSHRQTPDSMKSTLPLMAVSKDGRYVGLTWQPDPAFCALFDSPDRHLASEGHALGILYPGSDGRNREEGSLLPYTPMLLKAGQILTLYATLLGGKGSSIVPAVQQYVGLRGLPPLPRTSLSARKYVDAASAGWLDSGIASDGLFRHAIPGEFKPQPAADAALFMEWLADHTESSASANRLNSSAREALAKVNPADFNALGVGHVRYPAESLVFGHCVENAESAAEAGRRLLTRFTPEGTVLYSRSPNGPDFAKTHFAPDANGLTAQVVMSLLDSAATSGDPILVREGLKTLKALDKFADSAPRGAQTWEVALHTPDILASAYLVRAYILGYALTGDQHNLETAQYWAWTGIPFVYLTPPLTSSAIPDSGGSPAAAPKPGGSEPFGAYSTIAVLGATQWISPNWMGRPVQWCGLVYADALYRLSKYDPKGIWRALADGITCSGIQQVWPRGADPLRQGLLPDSVSLRAQIRNDSAINPGTLEANAVQLLTGAPLYEMHPFRANGLIIAHVPGRIRDTKEMAGRILFTIDAWPRHTYEALIVGFKKQPRVIVDGKELDIVSLRSYNENTGRLVLSLTGKPIVDIRL